MKQQTMRIIRDIHDSLEDVDVTDTDHARSCIKQAREAMVEAASYLPNDEYMRGLTRNIINDLKLIRENLPVTQL